MPDASAPINDRGSRSANRGNALLRASIRCGMTVLIVLKQDQSTGKLTRGVVKDILTRSGSHPHGIKVRLQSGLVGRVQQILESSPDT
jgi:uncharacterized repeat protein (TIGR03833 family)